MRFRLESVDANTDVAIHELDRGVADALADHCAAMRAVNAGDRKDDKLCMSIDPFFIVKWCDLRGITFAEFMRDPRLQTQFVEDPDHAAFRIWEGKL